MKMMDCPRWHSCNAAFCPFGGGSHLKGEATCYYLREFYKENAKANFENASLSHIYIDMVELAPEAIAQSIHIRKEVEKASKTKSRLARVGSKGTEGEITGRGVYGTVIEAGVGKGIANTPYTPIPPLPDAGNGIPEAGLTGDRNRCPTCREYFNSSKAFDQHRTGKFNSKRRCLTIGEMETNGFRKNRDGYWLSPVAEKDRERLAGLRKGSGKSKPRSEEETCDSHVHPLHLTDG